MDSEWCAVQSLEGQQRRLVPTVNTNDTNILCVKKSKEPMCLSCIWHKKKLLLVGDWLISTLKAGCFHFFFVNTEQRVLAAALPLEFDLAVYSVCCSLGNDATRWPPADESRCPHCDFPWRQVHERERDHIQIHPHMHTIKHLRARTHTRTM